MINEKASYSIVFPFSMYVLRIPESEVGTMEPLFDRIVMVECISISGMAWALSNGLTNMKQGWIIQNLNVLKIVEKDGWGGGHMVHFSFFSKQGSCLRFDWNSPTWLSYNCLSWNELTECKILTHLKFAPKVSKTFHPFKKKKSLLFLVH